MVYNFLSLYNMSFFTVCISWMCLGSTCRILKTRYQTKDAGERQQQLFDSEDPFPNTKISSLGCVYYAYANHGHETELDQNLYFVIQTSYHICSWAVW